MKTLKVNTNSFTTDDIHKMRLQIAEQYRNMTPDEAECDFKSHVDNAKRTMEALRKEKQLATN